MNKQLVKPNSKKKLPHGVIVRAPGLLPMMYRVSELCEDLGVPSSTLRDWLSKGAPCERDSKNRIWVDGKKFALWVESQRIKAQSKTLDKSEGYCLICKHIVTIKNPKNQIVRGKLLHIKGLCPKCGNVVVRGARHG